MTSYPHANQYKKSKHYCPFIKRNANIYLSRPHSKQEMYRIYVTDITLSETEKGAGLMTSG